MKVAVLGSSGQIGAYLTQYLTEKGHLVREFDIANDPHEDMTHIPNAFLRNVIMDSDFVFFLAFDVGGSHYLKKYQHTFKFINNNTRMMANVFGLLEDYQVPFVFASSQMSNMSYSPYGVMKRVGELYTKSLDGLIVKFWNVYGIEKDMEKAHVITDFIRMGLTNRSIDMMTDGTEEREFLYAEDCCEALETVMNNYQDFTSDDELHITSNQSTSIIEIANIIGEVIHKNTGNNVIINPSLKTDEVQKNKRNEPDLYITKWWQPKTSLYDGITKVFEAMRSNYEV